jgi:hypothetical protein
MWLFPKALLISSLLLTVAGAQQTAARFTELEHLDADAVKLSKTGETVTFLATWIAPELKSMRRVVSGKGAYIRTDDGQVITKYPEKMVLRISVGERTKVDGTTPIEFDSPYNADQLAKNLHFRLRVYNGLDYRVVEPTSAKMIGVPAELPYNQRIYLVEFPLKNVAVEERLMIEALDPNDTRVTRFTVSML